MCTPALVIGSAQAFSSYTGQRQAAAAQAQAQAQASAAEQQRARQANLSIRLRESQEAIARSQRKEAAQIKGMEARAKANLSALTEAGVSGKTLDMLMQNLGAQEARYMFSEDAQAQRMRQASTFQFEEEAMRTRMNQLRINQPIRQASLLSAGLSGVQAGLSTANALQGLKLFQGGGGGDTGTTAAGDAFPDGFTIDGADYGDLTTLLPPDVTP